MIGLVIFFMILSWVLSGVLILVVKLHMVIFNVKTREIIGIVRPLPFVSQILKKDYNLLFTNASKEIFYDKEGKIYLREDI